MIGNLLLLLLVIGMTDCDIKTLSPCKGQLDDGRLIDLTSLDNQAQPLWGNENLKIFLTKTVLLKVVI